MQNRGNDILELADFFLGKYKAKYGKEALQLSKGAMEAMKNYKWPGNVRELENVIERAVVMSPEEIIQVSDLPKDFVDNAHSTLHMDGIPVDASLYDTLALVEKNMIIRALKKANYVQAHAAEHLGIGKSGLNQKIKKYKLFDQKKAR